MQDSLPASAFHECKNVNLLLKNMIFKSLLISHHIVYMYRSVASYGSYG